MSFNFDFLGVNFSSFQPEKEKKEKKRKKRFFQQYYQLMIRYILVDKDQGYRPIINFLYEVLILLEPNVTKARGQFTNEIVMKGR